VLHIYTYDISRLRVNASLNVSQHRFPNTSFLLANDFLLKYLQHYFYFFTTHSCSYTVHSPHTIQCCKFTNKQIIFSEVKKKTVVYSKTSNRGKANVDFSKVNALKINGKFNILYMRRIWWIAGLNSCCCDFYKLAGPKTSRATCISHLSRQT